MHNISSRLLLLFIIGGIALSLATTLLQIEYSGSDNRERNILIFLNSVNITYIIVCFERLIYQSKNTRISDEKNLLLELLRQKEEYYKSRINQYEEIRLFRHDIKSHVFIMQKLLKENRIEDLEKYIFEFNTKMKNSSLKTDTGNSYINALLSAMIEQYQNVLVIVSGKLPENIKLSPIDICTIFSNLLSNAFEAASKSKKRDLLMRFYVIDHNLIIQISNSSDKTPVISRGKLLSHKKGKGHGIGNENARNCITTNNGLIMQTYKDNYFYSDILLLNQC